MYDHLSFDELRTCDYLFFNYFLIDIFEICTALYDFFLDTAEGPFSLYLLNQIGRYLLLDRRAL